MSLHEEEPPHESARIFRSAGQRTSSFSYRESSFRSSSLISFNGEFPLFSPISSSPLKFKGVPFSWEQIPGIPKHQSRSKKKSSSSDHLLPLPPAGATTAAATTKKLLEEISPKKSSQRDPFFAALVECSKDDDIVKGSSKNITRTLSDRFGLINMYTSCKRTCPVSESIVYLPRQQSSHYHR